jgi:Fe-S-cluster containining protein
VRHRRTAGLDVSRVELDGNTRRLSVLHQARLACKRGCSTCCVDDLSVFEVEAAPIRRRFAALLANGAPHSEGGCAFLDASGGCRIYAERPYVCRTQGLPLRWLEDQGGQTVEHRDICPKNETDQAIEELSEVDCFTLGPFEEGLARLQIAQDIANAALSGTGAGSPAPGAPRVRLRELFVKK